MAPKMIGRVLGCLLHRCRKLLHDLRRGVLGEGKEIVLVQGDIIALLLGGGDAAETFRSLGTGGAQGHELAGSKIILHAAVSVDDDIAVTARQRGDTLTGAAGGDQIHVNTRLLHLQTVDVDHGAKVDGKIQLAGMLLGICLELIQVGHAQIRADGDHFAGRHGSDAGDLKIIHTEIRNAHHFIHVHDRVGEQHSVAVVGSIFHLTAGNGAGGTGDVGVHHGNSQLLGQIFRIPWGCS